jgi:acyl-CoA dehydrogenase
MAALEDPDRARGLEEFDRAFWGHVGHSFANALRAWAYAWTGGVFAPAPAAGKARRFYKQLGRYASAFALAADMALLTLGGALKRQEMISARFGDILSELYLLSAVLKRWHEEGRQPADFPLVAWCMEAGFCTIEARFDAIFANFPNRPAAWLLRFLLLPLGLMRRGPPDRLTQACAEILLEPSATRERVTADIFRCPGNDGVARLERAFALVVAAAPLRDRLHQAHIRDIGQARAQNLINDAEAEKLRAAADAVAAAIAVDDFAPEALARRKASPTILQATDTIALPRNERERQTRSAPVAEGGS